MNLYSVVLFLHITGAMGYFISAGARVLALAALRRAQRVEQVRLVSALDGWVGPLFGVSLLLLLASGLYLAATAWGFGTGWIDVALASIVLMAPAGAVLMEPRRRAIVRLASAAPDGPVPPDLAQRIHDPILLAAVRTLPLLLLGIVFLMTTKPSLVESILAMVVALVLGVAASVPGLFGARPARTQEPTVAAQEPRASQPVGQ